jgi:peptidoglycan/LPS O-acetylase OafA/YrhL
MAVLICRLIAAAMGTPPHQGRYASIDGLRGYLAFFVFLHHACIWYFYLRSGNWVEAPSYLYTELGESSVVLFFMITGFLFFSKLLEGRTQEIDWGKLYISRVLRLGPLYLLVVFLVFIIVAYMSHSTLQEPLWRLAKEVLHWLGFTLLGAPDLNHIKNTRYIVAEVTWTLQYEWVFYCSLPVLGLAIGVRRVPNPGYVALGVLALLGLAMLHLEFYRLLSFVGGIAAAIAVRYAPFRKLASRRVSSFIALGSFASVISLYPSAYGAIPIVLLSLAFILIACGNDVFGLLVSPASRTLGEMAYGIYLMHGLMLFVAFNFVVGLDRSRSWTPMAHWMLVLGLTPILLLISYTTHRFIERPAMRGTAALTA